MQELYLLVLLVFTAEYTILISAVNPRLIKTLNFSVGGVDFYERYLRENKPLHVKEAVLHWPALQNWSSSYLKEKFENDESQLLQEDVPLHDLMEAEKSINVSVLKTNELSRDIYLPFLIQCEEFIKNIKDVRLILNTLSSNNIEFNQEELLILPLFSPISLYYFGINDSISGSDLKDVVMSVEAIPIDMPFHKVKLNPGDLIYLPKYSWYYLESPSFLNYIVYIFDMFAFKMEEPSGYIEMYNTFRVSISTSPETISCKNNRFTIKDVLKIDLENFEKYMHLRIPRKNERPQDVTLASGYKMPVLGLGTALLNESTYDAVKYALEVGYRLFDLAYGYPFSEVSFGKALSESSIPREDIFVVTKLHPRYLGYNDTLKAIEMSLENLNTSYIDLYLIHSMECDDFLLKCEEGEPHGTWKESWRAMEKAKRDGKIRSLGFSNIYGKTIYQLLDWSMEPVSVIQNWFDPLNQDVETRQICSKYNIRFMGYSTLGTRWQMLGLDHNPIMQSDTISRISGHYDYVVSHVVLRWAIHVNVTVIPRSSNPKHIKQNLRALDLSMFPSDIEELNQMEQIMKEMMELEGL